MKTAFAEVLCAGLAGISISLIGLALSHLSLGAVQVYLAATLAVCVGVVAGIMLGSKSAKNI